MKGIKEFNRKAVEAYPHEFSGLLTILDNEWHVYPVKTLPKDFDGDGFAEGFSPDQKDWNKKKKDALKRGEIIIGIIHSHPDIEDEDSDEWDKLELLHPSDIDLKYQRMFKHMVRGIVAVNSKGIMGMRFHDVNDETLEPDTCPLCRRKLQV